jgi:hypothetical protein
MFYILSIKWTNQNDEVFTFWCPNNSGYTKDIEKAGLYPKDKTIIREGIVFVKKDIIEKYKKEVKNKYSKKNYFVLPNRGQIRKDIGITKFDFKYSDTRERNLLWESEHILFDLANTFIEEEKIVTTNRYNVKLKECQEEFWLFDAQFEAETRNEAILKAQKEWLVDESYIEFKNMVSAKKVKETIFNGWSRLR